MPGVNVREAFIYLKSIRNRLAMEAAGDKKREII